VNNRRSPQRTRWTQMGRYLKAFVSFVFIVVTT
jgi:hypothetical protein